MSKKVRVWDLPTRLFHWALVLLIVGLAVSGYRGGDAMAWHARLGYAMLALLLFRIVWGFVGGRWSRFSAFAFSPRDIFRHLRGDSGPDALVGHNPLGAGSVFLMLFFLLAQVATGLVGDDEIAFTGPLNRFVESATGLAATSYHKGVGQWVLLALALLHIAAVVFYLVRRKDNLVRPMIVGDKELLHPTEPSRDDLSTRLRALAVLAACAAAVAGLVRLGG
ncbi:cytochrome b/b6 domain-containing protein [Ramlibacter solisilvae]|uniref:Cytochrome B561 n=1 Tax=Ramlibacter tataouinensis TaxID=94132 RepID=A0A127JSK6_9BURK|nr:cytochrome b/b6 domain-containing protein [Ramlibacter tataouinensis]AMO22974.1 cytochrome B561 [Ramlibacter tataouinensis]